MRMFFNNTFRAYDIAIGKMFNDVWVIHYDKTGKDIDEIKVPFYYMPKLHWYLRKYDNIPNDFNIKTVLPMMTFSRTAPQYDVKRQLNAYAEIKSDIKYSPETQRYVQKWAASAVPYKIPYEINVWTSTMNEMNQLLEQILGSFPNQTKNLFIYECPMFGVGRNCKVTIESTSSNYSSDFDIKGDRILRHKINLSIEGNIYGVIKEASVIEEIMMNYYSVETKENNELNNITDGTCNCDEEGNPTNNTKLSFSTRHLDENGTCGGEETSDGESACVTV